MLIKNYKLWNIGFLLGLAIFFKSIPYIPAISPQIIIILYLGSLLPPRQSVLMALIIISVSDLLGSYFNHYPAFGSFSWFTYSAYIIIVLYGNIRFEYKSSYKFVVNSLYSKSSQIEVFDKRRSLQVVNKEQNRKVQLMTTQSILMSIWFWIWTNFGVWLTSGMYNHTFAGFFLCYYYALPFLINSLIACLIWSTAFNIYYLCARPSTRNLSLPCSKPLWHN